MSGSPNRTERLDAYLDGELAPEERSALEHDLEASPTLRRALEERRRLDRALRFLPAVEVSPHFEARFRARLARAGEPRGWARILEAARSWGSVLAGPAGVAAALFLFLGDPSLPESDWDLITDPEVFELVMDEDPNLLAALDVLETWNERGEL